jgi:hypothetical protein
MTSSRQTAGIEHPKEDPFRPKPNLLQFNFSATLELQNIGTQDRQLCL